MARRLRVRLPRVKVARRRRRRLRRVKGGLFRPPRHKWLAKIVTFESVEAASKAARKLVNALKHKRIGGRKIGRKLALAIARSLQNAANRAKAMLRRRNLRKTTRKRFKALYRVYDRAAKQAFQIYHSKYKGG